MVNSCSTCYFWADDYAGPNKAECRRYAPRPSLLGIINWPLTDSWDWCGEYVDRTKKAKPIENDM